MRTITNSWIMIKKIKVRNLCRKAFNEDFYFVHTDNIIIVPSKDSRKSKCLEDDIKNICDSYLLKLENESLNDCLKSCMPCWVITRCKKCSKEVALHLL